MPAYPVAILSSAKKISSAIAVTISGAISGRLIIASTMVWPRKAAVRVVAMAAIVASSEATTAATMAMPRERKVAAWTSVLCQASTYQRREKPSQIAIE